MPTSRSVSQFSIETLATPLELVVPRALPTNGIEDISPLVIPADWVSSVEFSTSWRTDITAAADKDLDNEECVGLLTRPARTISITFTGRNNEETHALAQMLLNYAQAGGPAPLLQDAVVIKSTAVEGGNLRVYGDFSYGHYYVGQRVLLQSQQTATSRDANSSQWGYILETNSSSLLLQGLPARTPLPGEEVIPCFDADLVTSSSGTFITDSLLRAKVTFEETAGPETLPASFQPAAFDNLSTLLQMSEEGKPILSIGPNWSNGIGVRIVRKASSQAAGRSTVSAASGKPFFVFTLELLAGSRRDAWRLLQVFDAFRGRAGSFLFFHPNQPWKFHSSPFASSSAANIVQVGSRNDIEHFNKAAFTKADGRVFVRDVSSVQKVGSTFRLNLSSPLPDTDFVSVQPIHECGFFNDTLDMEWKNTTVAGCTIEIREIRGTTPTTVPGGYRQLTADFGRFRTLITASDPQVWLEPSTNSYSARVEGGFIASSPGYPFKVARVFDPREVLPSILKEDFKPSRPFLYPGTSSDAVLVSYADRRASGGKMAVIGAMWTLSSLVPISPPLQLQQLWSNVDGWTFILCVNPHLSGSRPDLVTWSGGVPGWNEGELLRISVGGVDMFNFFFTQGNNPPPNTAGISIKDSSGIVHSSLPLIAPTTAVTNYTLPSPANTAAINGVGVLVIRYDPSLGRIYMHLNGKPCIPNGYFNIPGIFTNPTYSGFWIGGGFNVMRSVFPPFNVTKGLLSKSWGSLGSVNALLSWPRCLSESDTNALASSVASNYGGDWMPVTY